MIEPRRRPPRPDLAGPGRARRRARRDRLRAVRRHLLPPLVPAGPERRPVPQAGADQPGPARAHRGPARLDRRPLRQRARREPPVQRRQARPGQAAARARRPPWPPTASRSSPAPSATRATRATRSRSRPSRPTCKARFARLAKVLKMSSATIQDRVVRSLYLASFSPATIRVGVADAVRDYIEERNEAFPGVNVDRVYLRSYPNKGLAAQLVGSVSEISDKQLEQKAYAGIPAGTRIGQSGLEAEYDRYLRGRDGIQRLIVDAQGNLKGKGSTRRPVTGRTVKLSLDLGLQRFAQEGLPAGRAARSPARSSPWTRATARSWPWGPSRPSTPPCSPSPSPASATTRCSARRRAARCSTGPPASIRPARPSSRSRRSPRCRPGSRRPAASSTTTARSPSARPSNASRTPAGPPTARSTWSRR